MIHPTTHRWSRILFAPVIKCFEYLSAHHPVTLMRIRYFLLFHRLPNLRHPQTLNEKILHLKLFTDTTPWVDLTDKYRVRRFVEDRGLSSLLVTLYAVWHSADDINFDALPNSFILKANNGGGNSSCHIVHDKAALTQTEREAIKEQVLRWLNTTYEHNIAAEPQIRNIKPCVVAEQLLPIEQGETSVVDYKFWCFNGEPDFVYVISNRKGHVAHVMPYNLDWQAHPEWCVPTQELPLAEVRPKPDNFAAMVEAARILASGFPCVRVDLYNIHGTIYFGEMTFTSQGGLMDYFTPEFQLEAGRKIAL